jgi:hypothetical protein
LHLKHRLIPLWKFHLAILTAAFGRAKFSREQYRQTGAVGGSRLAMRTGITVKAGAEGGGVSDASDRRSKAALRMICYLMQTFKSASSLQTLL